jgi:hypothetical protein
MNRPTTIATIAVIHVGRMFAAAVVLMAAAEAVNWAMIWNDARREK